MNVMEEFKKNLDEMKDKLEPILKTETDRFIQIVANYIEQNEGLLSKNRASLYSAIIRAAQNGVCVDGQEAALVPFKESVTLMIMYKGLLKQIRNSGELDSINCGVAYENDLFEYFVDENGEHLKHVPNYKVDRGKPINAYMIARIKGGHCPYIEVMTEAEIQDCKNVSRAGSNSPWQGKFADEMRKKTVLRRGSKRLPMSTDLNAAIHADDDLFMPPDEAQDPQEEKTTSTGLHDAVTPAPEPEQEQKTGFQQEGIIEEAKIFPVTIKGKPTNRYGGKIKDVWYGTFDEELFKQIQDNCANKSTVWMFYTKETRPSGKGFNECIKVETISTPDSKKVPI